MERGVLSWLGVAGARRESVRDVSGAVEPLRAESMPSPALATGAGAPSASLAICRSSCCSDGGRAACWYSLNSVE
jgi:hypothetical protein